MTLSSRTTTRYFGILATDSAIYFSLRILEKRKLRENWVTLIPARLIPRVIRSRAAETRGSFPVGKVNKCRGGATSKFEACSEFRVGAWHGVSDGFDASKYTANRFSNSSPLCTRSRRAIEQIRLPDISLGFNLTQDALNVRTQRAYESSRSSTRRTPDVTRGLTFIHCYY